MPLVGPVAATQCAAVRTTSLATSAPPQPIDRRTIHGNSPLAAGEPPTTGRWADAVGMKASRTATTSPMRTTGRRMNLILAGIGRGVLGDCPIQAVITACSEWAGGRRPAQRE